MIIDVDLSEVPARTSLREPHTTDKFSIVVRVPEHGWVSPDVLVELAGPVATSSWLGAVGRMREYATSRGWTDGAGRLRAHIVVERDI